MAKHIIGAFLMANLSNVLTGTVSEELFKSGYAISQSRLRPQNQMW